VRVPPPALGYWIFKGIIMKASEIKKGGVYIAKVGGKFTVQELTRLLVEARTKSERV
jgi:hypothetical protein